MSHSYNERGTLMISFSQLLEKDHGEILSRTRTWDIGQGASTAAATGVLQALDSGHFQQELKALDSLLATAQPKNGFNVTWQRNDINL